MSERVPGLLQAHRLLQALSGLATHFGFLDDGPLIAFGLQLSKVENDARSAEDARRRR